MYQFRSILKYLRVLEQRKRAEGRTDYSTEPVYIFQLFLKGLKRWPFT